MASFLVVLSREEVEAKILLGRKSSVRNFMIMCGFGITRMFEIVQIMLMSISFVPKLFYHPEENTPNKSSLIASSSL
jgi:hypothetical protein